MLAAIAPSISAGSERPPSDPSEWQAFAFFAHQSHQARQRDRKTKHALPSRNASLSSRSMGHPSTAWSEVHFDRTFMMSVSTDDGAARGAFGASQAP